MWPIVCKHALGTGSAIFVGWSIRLMDDALDVDLDATLNKINWSERLGKGTTAYALFAMALGLLLEPSIALSFFAGAYAVGMVGKTHILPSNLPSNLEGLVLLLLVLWRYGLKMAWLGVGIMIAAQLIDDLLDRGQDQWLQAKNWTIGLGVAGSILVACTLVAILYWLDQFVLIYAALAFSYFETRERFCKGE